MKLQKVYIKNFRGIEELFLDFQGKTNLLIGENGCGKTSILDAIKYLTGKLYPNNIKKTDFSKNQDEFKLYLKTYEGNNRNLMIAVSKSTNEEDPKIKRYMCDDSFLNEESNDRGIVNFKTNEVCYIDKDRGLKIKNNHDNFYNPINKLIKMYNLQVANEKEENIKNIGNEINNISPEIEDKYKFLPLNINDIFANAEIVEDKGDNCYLPIELSGSGVEQFFAIKFLITQSKESNSGLKLLLIDEPEQNLHPKLQESLIDFLKEAGIQCIFTSHSPTFVKHCMNNKNCEVLICEKNGEKIEVKPMKDKIEGDNKDNKGNKNYKFLENHTNSQAVANFLAFDEYSTDLHNLLYGLLEEKGDNKFKNGNLIWYKKTKNGYYKEENKSIHYIIRNLIHHPENKNEDNLKYKTKENLEQSINEMINLLNKIN